MNQSNGALTECITTGNGLNDPIGITVNNDYAYVTNNKKWSTAGTISVCQIDKSDATLNNCVETPPSTGFNNVAGVTVNNNYLYATNYNGAITKCAINSKTGALNSCNTIVNNIKSIGVTVANNFAYLTNYDDNIVNKCILNKDDGSVGVV